MLHGFKSFPFMTLPFLGQCNKRRMNIIKNYELGIRKSVRLFSCLIFFYYLLIRRDKILADD
jgi:hypothetical protein